jgi:proteasome lid subunit RPN8/RPN11
MRWCALMIKLSKSDYEKILKHAESELPNEACGLIGGENCTQRRQRLQRYLGLPELLSAKLLLEVVNKMYTRSGFLEAVRKLDSE